MAQAPIQFDRASGALEGANLWERTAALALVTGSKISSHFSHMGYIACANLLRKTLPERNIAIKLNPDAVFEFPYGDGYWSKLLNRAYHYEDELELLFADSIDVDYTLLDCGANYGYWSVLVSSAPYGSHRAIAIEPPLLQLHLAQRDRGLLKRPREVGHGAAHARVGVGERLEHLVAGMDQADNLALPLGQRPVEHSQRGDQAAQLPAPLGHHRVEPGQVLVGGQEAPQHLGQLVTALPPQALAGAVDQELQVLTRVAVQRGRPVGTPLGTGQAQPGDPALQVGGELLAPVEGITQCHSHEGGQYRYFALRSCWITGRTLLALCDWK